jgi:hypothetical protein
VKADVDADAVVERTPTKVPAAKQIAKMPIDKLRSQAMTVRGDIETLRIVSPCRDGVIGRRDVRDRVLTWVSTIEKGK